MKKVLLLVLFALPAVLACYGQGYSLDKDTSKYKNNPLYIFTYKDSKDTTVGTILSGINNIDSIAIFRNIELIKKYGDQATHGIVSIRLKNKPVLITLGQLFDKFNINTKDRTLPLFIDSALAYRPEAMLFELNAIRYIKVAKEKSTGMKYVSIRSNYNITRPKKEELYIKGIDGKTK